MLRNPKPEIDPIDFVRRHGIVLESAKGDEVPTLAEDIAGGPIRGSWWCHPRGRQIFAATRRKRESSDILVCRLLNGKITYVHRRLWPALVRLSNELGVLVWRVSLRCIPQRALTRIVQSRSQDAYRMRRKSRATNSHAKKHCRCSVQSCAFDIQVCRYSGARHLRVQAREPQKRQVPNAHHRLDGHILRALNKLEKPSTTEEIAELLNRDLGPGDQPFQVREVATWSRNAEENVLCLYWLGNRPRRLLAILDALVLTSGVRIDADATFCVFRYNVMLTKGALWQRKQLIRSTRNSTARCLRCSRSPTSQLL